MFLLMGISLYTSRVVLQVLGIEDYGIYNIVGGMVVFFHFLNSTVNGTLQRFYNVEIAKGNKKGLISNFHAGLGIQLFFCFLVIFFSETGGLWMVNNYLKIDSGRLFAANIVFQFSILTFCANLLRTPFQALLIAYERMNFFAYISVVEAALKLLSVYLLLVFGGDKLILYTIFQFPIILIATIAFAIYVSNTFRIPLGIRSTKSYLMPLLNYSGWNLLGSIFALAVNQAIGIFINVFYGVAVNAAIGIANQISNIINQFVYNFSVAFSPQIVKLHTAKEWDKFAILIYQSSKTAFFLYAIIAIPFCCVADIIMGIWLVEVPLYAVLFTQLCLIDYAVESLTSPLYSAIQASGKVKRFNIGLCIMFSINIPVLYFVLSLGVEPYWAFIIKILTDVTNLGFRIHCMCRSVHIKLRSYLNKVILPLSAVIAIVIPFYCLIYNVNSNILKVVLSIIVLVPIIVFSSSIICYNKSERTKVINIIKNIF